MIGAMKRHLAGVSIFDNPAPSLALGLLGINLVLTLVHSIEEFNGRLWGYFGAIAGIRVPTR